MKGKIMIVDDEEHIRRLYSEELSDEGDWVVIIPNGYRILDKDKRENPDFVVLDIKLIVTL